MPQQMPLPFTEAVAPMPTRQPADVRLPAVSGGRRTTVKVPASRAFHDAVMAYCERVEATPGEVVEAVRRLLHPDHVQGFDDPGGPRPDDIMVLWRQTRSGGLRRVRTVPTLKVKTTEPMPASYMRRCLSLALALARPDRWSLISHDEIGRWRREAEAREHALKVDRDAVTASLERLAFKPLEGGVRTPAQAARILGLISEFGATPEVVTRRFRELIPVFHPDTGLLPCGDRVRQLVEAKRVLMDFARD